MTIVIYSALPPQCPITNYLGMSAVLGGLRYLSLTQQGKQIVANLNSNVFVVEHEKQE